MYAFNALSKNITYYMYGGKIRQQFCPPLILHHQFVTFIRECPDME